MSDQANQQFQTQKIYLKDVSFETPHSPLIFTEQGQQPQINLQLNNKFESIKDNLYEVVLNLTVTTKVGEKTAYLAEIQQAGIFLLSGFEEEQIQRALNVFCLNILFPYGCEALSSLITKGGFPPLLLNPVNFEALYQQRLKSQQEQSTH